MPDVVPSVVQWLRLHPGVEPQERKRPSNDEEETERAVARQLRLLRGKHSAGKVTDQQEAQLAEVMPQWHAASRGGHGSKTPEAVLEDVREIIDWCGSHNGHKLVTKPPTVAMDTGNQWHAIYTKLYNLKKVASRVPAALHEEAFGLLDRAYPMWRGQTRVKGTPDDKSDSLPGICKRPKGQQGGSDQEARSSKQARLCVASLGLGEEEGGDGAGVQSDVNEGEEDQPEHVNKSLQLGLADARQNTNRVIVLQPNLAGGLAEECQGETEGWADAANFVVTFDNVPGWTTAVAQPAGQGRGKARVADPFASANLRVDYKGYGPLKGILQYGDIAIIRLRCERGEADDPSQQAAVKDAFLHSRFVSSIRSMFAGRKRMPNVALEFPVVLFADLNAMEDAKVELGNLLKEITGLCKRSAPAVSPLAVSATVEVGRETEVVKPVTRENQTVDSPYSVHRGDALDKGGPKGMAVDEEGRGKAFTVFVYRSMPYAPGPPLDRIITAGILSKDAQDEIFVAMSWTRAHAQVLADRYGLQVDMRKRGANWSFGFSHLHQVYSGSSLGAAIAVSLAALVTGRTVPASVHVTGCASIPGMVSPVASYQTKLNGIFGELTDTGAQVIPQFLVPHGSVVDGALVEGGLRMAKIKGSTARVAVPSYCQVRVSKPASRGARVLAFTDLFDAVELCLDNRQTMYGPRDQYMPGLVVVKALDGIKDRSDVGWIQPVEVFLYRGSGLVIATGEHGLDRIAAAGINLVRNSWAKIFNRWNALDFKTTPDDASWDVHVHVPSTSTMIPASGHVSWAAAVGYLSLLMGKHMPYAAVLGEAQVDGSLHGPCLTKGMLKAAREAGVKTIYADEKQRAAIKGFMASCSDAERGEIQITYPIDAADVLMELCCTMSGVVRLPDLPPPVVADPNEDEEEGAASDGEHGEGGQGEENEEEEEEERHNCR